jgi:hypothetical protein
MDMKAQFKTLVMACVMAAGTIVAAPVFAASASPVNTTFVATGATNLSIAGINVPCTSNFVLVTDGSGNVSVTQATFSGGGLCSSVHANNLPWSVSLPTTTTAVINGVNVTASIFTCAGSANATIGSSAITLVGTISSSCSATGTLGISPTFTVH